MEEINSLMFVCVSGEGVVSSVIVEVVGEPSSLDWG